MSQNITWEKVVGLGLHQWRMPEFEPFLLGAEAFVISPVVSFAVPEQRLGIQVVHCEGLRKSKQRCSRPCESKLLTPLLLLRLLLLLLLLSEMQSHP